MPECYDCIIIGGGPAGLTAAIYLSRFQRKVLVIDAGASRARMIPLSRNHAGFPDGISGSDLLARMRRQAEQFGTHFHSGDCDLLEPSGDGFHVACGSQSWSSRAVLVATGVTNRKPPLEEGIHQAALDAGLLRYCPICDAYEVRGKRIAVLGSDAHGLAEALFLRTYSSDITLLTMTEDRLDASALRNARNRGILHVPAPVIEYDFHEGSVTVRCRDGQTHSFDTLYPALGSDGHCGLLTTAGVRLDDDDCLVTDKHQRTNVAGVYAAGDIVAALDQISVASGHGAIAATTIHNDLRKSDGLTPE